MEQIQIRQPKMPAAQSFIQILGTFLATLFIFYSRAFSFIKSSPFIWRTAKSLVALDLALKIQLHLTRGENVKGGLNLRI
jgi:hypothetical protein